MYEVNTDDINDVLASLPDVARDVAQRILAELAVEPWFGSSPWISAYPDAPMRVRYSTAGPGDLIVYYGVQERERRVNVLGLTLWD